MNLGVALTEEDRAESIARKTSEFILMSKSEDPWVTTEAYCKRWSVSKMHLHRYKEFYKQNKAVDGEGKRIRYNKFFSPSGIWRYC